MNNFERLLENSLREEFEVKYAKKKNDKIQVAKYKAVADAKNFLNKIRKDGGNGIITKNGKPVK